MTRPASTEAVADCSPVPMEPVRLAFCITELDAGGAERALSQLVRSLDRSRWDSRVYCLGPPGVFASVLQDDGVPVVCFNAVHLWDAPRVVWQLARELRAWNPKLLQTFLFHANILGRIAGRLAGVPHIVCGQRVAERRTSWYGRIDRWTGGLVDRHVCVSHGVADYCEHIVGLPQSRLLVIPNGVDTARFAAAQPIDWRVLGIPGDRHVLISIGRLEPQKGFDILLDAFASIASAFPSGHLVIVGDGPDWAVLQERAAKPELTGRVTFLGRREDVPRLLAGSIGLVLASRWEGMPNVVLEAMAAGKPVIATEVEGTADLVTAGKTGWLVPVSDVPALASAIRELLVDRDRADQLGRESQLVVQSRFTPEAMAGAYDRLYRELVSGGHEPRV